ncbi:MAG: rhomboid family intramembrane serine protease [Verrucomicrobiota bacterium]|nr:rhomboid family intramembrane serine protease [Verrucomicrobiota bacterium]
MLDLNLILLLVACLSPVVVLARTARRAARNRSWRLAASAVLCVTAVSAWIAPRHAGYIGGGAWFALLFLPAVGLRKVAELAAEENFTAAQRVIGFLKLLHPTRTVREEGLILRALATAQAGDSRTALDLLAPLAPNDTRAGRQAAAQSFRLRGDWAGLLAWSRQNIPRVGLGEDPTLLPLYFRALGELGLRDELILQFAGRAGALLASPVQQPTFATSMLLLLAFTGRSEALRVLLRTRLAGLREDTRAFWLATAETAADDSAKSRAHLQKLSGTTTDALIRRDIAQRLTSNDPLPPAPLTRSSQDTLDRLERGTVKERSSLLLHPSSRATPAVATFIFLNVIMFATEVALGGATNSATLHRLGALEPFSVLFLHQYWRLFGALFLHYGAIHLLFNVYALYVLGPPLENTIGSVRFVVCYLVSGLGSSLGVVLLWRVGWTHSDFLVGASGCVMGVVGAWAGWLLRHRHSLMARQRLTSIGTIVVLQTAFDFYTPQVSMTAHLGGLLTGVLVGLAITRREL